MARQRRSTLLSLCLLLLAGCATDNRGGGSANNTPAPANNDPLLGKVNVPAPPTPVAAGPAGTGGVLPAPIGPSTQGSTAALASGAGNPLNGPNDLRIDDGGNPASRYPQGTVWSSGAASSPPTNPSAVPVSQPLPQVPPVPAPTPPQPVSSAGFGPPPMAAAPSAGLAFEQIEARLAALGTTWQQLTVAGEHGESTFTCSVPRKENPNNGRVYTEKGKDAISAMRAVVDAIDKSP